MLGISRRSFLEGTGALGLGTVLAPPAWPALTEDAGQAALDWLAALSSDLREQASYPFMSQVRYDWHYARRLRPGVALGEMDFEARHKAWGLLAKMMSREGLDRVRNILRLETILGRRTNHTDIRNPDNYFLVLFGDPGRDPIWACRFEGFHISLNFTIAPGYGVSMTPAFLGASPANVPETEEMPAFSVFGDVAGLAFKAARGINGGLLDHARVSPAALGNILALPGREASVEKVEGVALVHLPGPIGDHVMDIARLYLNMLSSDYSPKEDLKLENTREQIHFAWAGGLYEFEPHYFRIHGPSLLIEYDASQADGNHVHTVWHSPTDNFGASLMQRIRRG